MSKWMTRLQARVRRLRRAQDGGAAVEFALVGMVFFWVLLGILELGTMLIMSNSFDDALADTARLVRTGQVARNNLTHEELKKKICEELVFGGSCRSKLLLDIRRYTDFASMRPPPPPGLDQDGNIDFTENFQPGQPKEVVLVRAYYRWDFVTPFMGMLMGNFGNDYMIGSAATFRNEPYEQQ